MTEPLWTDSEWTFDRINRSYDEIEKIGLGELGLNVYRNQIEIIGSEQMLDAYCLTPDHKVLRSDMRWIPMGEIDVGEVILGFDENGPLRSFKNAQVLRIERAIEPCFAVTLVSGHIFKVTREHRWLVRQSRGQASALAWKHTYELRSVNTKLFSSSRITKLIDVWS